MRSEDLQEITVATPAPRAPKTSEYKQLRSLSHAHLDSIRTRFLRQDKVEGAHGESSRLLLGNSLSKDSSDP
jgi:hypothetical protein